MCEEKKPLALSALKPTSSIDMMCAFLIPSPIKVFFAASPEMEGSHDYFPSSSKSVECNKKIKHRQPIPQSHLDRSPDGTCRKKKSPSV